MSIEFVDDLPPMAPRGARPGPRKNLRVEELKTQPGKWARVKKLAPGRSAGATGTTLRNHGCETATRTIDGQAWLFARWPAEATP